MTLTCLARGGPMAFNSRSHDFAPRRQARRQKCTPERSSRCGSMWWHASRGSGAGCWPANRCAFAAPRRHPDCVRLVRLPDARIQLTTCALGTRSNARSYDRDDRDVTLPISISSIGIGSPTATILAMGGRLTSRWKKSAPWKGVYYPACIAGDRAGPPEDCGGIRGVSRHARVHQGTAYRFGPEWIEWLGPDYHPTTATCTRSTRRSRSWGGK